jgi:uncharacterized protein (TIGR02996 family)
VSDIIAHPADDAPRLIFADWLDDHGEAARAEFIRLQCRLARLRDDDPARKPLAQRERQLLGEHARRWAAPLHGAVEEWAFRRGFLECISVGRHAHQAFRARRDELFAAYPLTAVRLEGEAGLLLALLARPDYLARLDSLDVKNLEGADAQRVLDGLMRPEAAGLRSLLLESEESTPEWDRQLLRLAGPGPLGGLTELGLAFGTVGEPPSARVLAAVAGSAGLAGLRKLHLPFTTFALPTAKLLADSPTLAHLTHLDLGCAHVTEPGWRRLLAGANTRRLRWLGLFGANVERGGSASLKDHPFGQELRALLGEAADFDTSETFPRWSGQRWGD